MDFGRIPNYEQVNYALPAGHPGLLKVFGGQRHATPKVHVGGVRWASESFPGLIYPVNVKQVDHLSYYTQQFNSIELNSTHYGIPAAPTLQRWLQLAPESFHFCPKVHQAVSHAADLRTVKTLHAEFAGQLRLLQSRLGVMFMQLPPHFSTQRAAELYEFLDDNPIPGLMVELRHPTWYSQENQLSKLCNYLYQRGLGLVLTDTPGRRDVLHMRVTNKTAFIRFNAHTNYEGDKVRINEWIQRIIHWFSMGLEQLYFFIHSPQQLSMPSLVTYFIESLNNQFGEYIPGQLISPTIYK